MNIRIPNLARHFSTISRLKKYSSNSQKSDLYKRDKYKKVKNYEGRDHLNTDYTKKPLTED
mgnify:CR=1 FL=1